MKKILLLSILTLSVFASQAQTVGDTIYVNKNAAGLNDGSSWANAHTELAYVFSSPLLDTNDVIWVAEGVYIPIYDYGYNPTPTEDRDKEFFVSGKYLSIFGGFNGTETELSQRDWVQNPTILSGDIGISGDESDNSFTVFRALNSSVHLDGLTITDGLANGAANQRKYGAGIYFRNWDENNTLVIKNCIIKDNTAYSDAGVYCFAEGKHQEVLVENTRFTNNLGRWRVGLSIFPVNGTVNATVVNCLFDNNEVGSTMIGGTQYDGVFAPAGGFGPDVTGKLINCTFTKNIDNGTSIDDVKCTFAIQGATNETEFHNCIFYDNDINPTNSSIGFGSNAGYTPANVDVFNTISEDDMGALSYVTATNNTQVNPLFVNSSANDFTLQSSSPAINSGSTSGIATFIPITDLAGNTREDGVIDLGCYEFQNSSGINDSKSNSLKSYPNPTTNILNFTELVNTVKVFDLAGKLVFNVSNPTNQIDLSALETGTYLIQLENENGVSIQKIIKE